MKNKKIIWPVAGGLFFIVYFFAAARPVPPETVLSARWLKSTESVSLAGSSPTERADTPSGTETDIVTSTERSGVEGGSPLVTSTDRSGAEGGSPLVTLLPFSLGSRFGYVDSNGRFTINQIKKGEVYLSESLWSEYAAEPSRIEIRDARNKEVVGIEEPGGYPCILDGRIFLVGREQNALSEIDAGGRLLWTYEFAAPLTCIDAAAGLVLAGSIDGVVEVLDRQGKRLFFFEPGGSRYAVITGCAISRDGLRLGIISGIDDQRFLLLEQFGGEGGEYKVVYHEFLGDGFRRPVHISFIEEDRWIVFEREGGMGVYELSSRQGAMAAFEGEIADIDRTGGQGLFFAVVSRPGGWKELVGLRLPGKLVMRAPFKSESVFLGRKGNRLFIGGGSTLASLELEKK